MDGKFRQEGLYVNGLEQDMGGAVVRKAARTHVLAGRLPVLRAVDAGPLAASRFVEEITALLLGINRRYKTQAAVQIVGLPG